MYKSNEEERVMNNTRDYPTMEEEKTEWQIERELNLQNKEIEILSEQFNRLEERLKQALLNEPVDANGEWKDIIELVPIANTLRYNNSKISWISAKLASLISRIEI